MINITIKKQHIIIEKTRHIIANSINFVTATCTFDEEWNGFTKQLVFTNGDISKTLPVTDGDIFTVPYEVLIPGKLEISAVGYGSHGEVRITTKKMSLPLMVHSSGEITGGAPENYTPELWEHISSVVGNVSELSVDAPTLVDAINAIVNAENSDGIVMQKDDSGFFQTVDTSDDTTTYYLHDKKTLSESVNIIRLSENSFDFSNDGGKTFPYTLSAGSNIPSDLSAELANHKNNFNNPHNISAEQIGAVPVARQINGHSLNQDITLTAEQLGAVSSARKVNGLSLNRDITLSAEQIGAIPASRTINGKPLSSDIVLTASDTGAEVSGTASETVNTHNISLSAHNDIRIILSEFSARLNTVANSDDITLDQLSEIVSYIKNNKTLIESVTTNKINVADIVNNLETSATTKPLSASQGVVLKRLLAEHFSTKTNPHDVTYTQVGAAPTGYGYGGSAVSLGNISNNTDFTAALDALYDETNATETKLITWVDNATTWRWFATLYKSSTNNGILIASSPIYAGTQMIKTKYYGVWNDWEWINPPMYIGTEYRTAERYMGKPVYTALINLGQLPSEIASQTSIYDILNTVGSPKTDTLVYTELHTIDSNGGSWLNDTQSLTWFVGKQSSGNPYIRLKPTTDLSSYSARLLLKYTKV